MTLKDIEKLATQEIMKTDWHWFNYHFSHIQILCGNQFSHSVINCCYESEQKMEGYAANFIKKLASYCNSEKDMNHYDQLLQHVAELVVVSHLARTLNESWIFQEEPKNAASNKNPEISISNGKLTILVEVKSPRFFEFQRKRKETGIQLPSRIGNGFKNMIENIHDTKASLPRDNIVKDFLISADSKFKSFKDQDANVLSVLVIAWDDFIYEPISSLVNDFTGLITDNSYYKNSDNHPIKFENIDNIILLRNMTQIVNATRDIQVTDGLEHPLDYGCKGRTLPIPIITVNEHRDAHILYDIFQCIDLEELKDVAEYKPQDFIMWM